MPSVADFLLQRMEHAGINHVFGVPGDYVLNFYKKLSDSENVDLINCTDEAHAGFAANAYARLKGIGCVCVTYNVGALKIANSVACAYAERCPVVVISGSPGIKERQEDMLLHHMVRSFECQKEVFQNLTCASIVLDNPTTAGYEIDRAFELMKHHKQPIYIELPRDVADKPIGYDVYRQGTPQEAKTDMSAMEEALKEVKDWIGEAKNPVILAGVQLSRFDLGTQMLKFAERVNIPIATTLLSKSIINERHPLFLGVYAGNASQEGVKKAVEESDCLLMFGVLLTDMTLTFMPAKFRKRNCVNCAVEGLKIKSHTYTGIQFKDFCSSLFKEQLEPKRQVLKSSLAKVKKSFNAIPNEKISTSRFFDMVDSILDEDKSVIADVGDCLFGATDLLMHNKSSFIASAFYTSMGNAIPGALGMIYAQPDKRPIVLVGDGAFQMSCTELSTLVKRNLNPIVFVLNNNGYTTERFLLDGKFNDVHNWQYHEIAKMIGGDGFLVNTEVDLKAAVDFALESKKLTIINVVVDKMDVSSALTRMTEGLAKRI